jgi:hypothetical protein
MGVRERGKHESTPVERRFRSGVRAQLVSRFTPRGTWGTHRRAGLHSFGECAHHNQIELRVNGGYALVLRSPTARLEQLALELAEHYSCFARPAVELLGESVQLLATSLEHS